MKYQVNRNEQIFIIGRLSNNRTGKVFALVAVTEPARVVRDVLAGHRCRPIIATAIPLMVDIGQAPPAPTEVTYEKSDV